MADTVSPRSVAVMKRQVWEAEFQTLPEATVQANHEMELSFQTADFKEGVAHFLEKRAARFTGAPNSRSGALTLRALTSQMVSTRSAIPAHASQCVCENSSLRRAHRLVDRPGDVATTPSLALRSNLR
jgi:hypothetical protein